MSIERISTIQTASVITQPTEATERLTLIEKLEKKATQYLQCKKDAKTLHDVRYFGGNANGFTEAINIVKQHQVETCNWRNNKDTDGWYEWSDCGDYSSDCGLEWNMSNDDSPLENDMNFCPKCGRKIVEIQPPSEVQDAI